MTIQERLMPQDAAERDAGLDKLLAQFHAIDDPGIVELRADLKKSWEEYVAINAFRLAHDKAFGKAQRLQPREEKEVTVIRISTTSEGKWRLLAPLIVQAGYQPIRDTPPEDESSVHRHLRSKLDFPKMYSVRIVASKQPIDTLGTPLFTLDTVTIVEGIPIDKSKDSEEAKEKILQISGKRISTETSLMLGMQVKSGAAVALSNTIKVTYTVQPLETEAVATYVAQTPTVLDVPIGVDLSTAQARAKFIDMNHPITLSRTNHLGKEAELTMSGFALESSIFDSLFSGVPTHAINALLPMVNDIYLHGDPYFSG